MPEKLELRAGDEMDEEGRTFERRNEESGERLKALHQVDQTSSVAYRTARNTENRRKRGRKRIS
jgi:hypothetical protein